MSTDVIIIGAGIAGLSCARELGAKGLSISLLESSNRIGGRIKTDLVNGFLLDRGFQVFLTAYPEARRTLNYDSLELKSFYPGALIRVDGEFRRLSDPWRKPLGVLADLFKPALKTSDALKLARMRRQINSRPYDALFDSPERTTKDYLAEKGFSSAFIDRFFRPFFGGVFLDSSLSTSSKMFEFVFRMMATGEITLPNSGMEMIPQQLALPIPADQIRVGTPVTRIRGKEVRLATGEVLNCDSIVVATDGRDAEKLLSLDRKTFWRETCCFYFAAPEPPFSEPILLLNGTGEGPINNLSVLSNVSSAYAPEGSALISVTSLSVREDNSLLLNEVRAQLISWFGRQASHWKHLRTYHIPRALPDQRPPALSPPQRSVRRGRHLYACGDYLDNASINGAIHSGRRAAEAVWEDLSGR